MEEYSLVLELATERTLEHLPNPIDFIEIVVNSTVDYLPSLLLLYSMMNGFARRRTLLVVKSFS